MIDPASALRGEHSTSWRNGSFSGVKQCESRRKSKRSARRPGTSLGLLEAGRRADLLLLRLDSHCFTPLNDPLRQLVLCSPRSALAGSIIGGHVVMQGGEITGVNEREILQEFREIAASLSTRGTEAKALADQLVESVRAGWLEAFCNQVGVPARKIPQ